jgi:hypothetical protein
VGKVYDLLLAVAGEEASAILPSGRFAMPEGALTPDQVDYCRPEAYRGALSEEGLHHYFAEFGYWPRVVVTGNAVYGIGRTHKIAAQALDFALDVGLIAQYATAFGGASALSPEAVHYLENWELDSYRGNAAAQ